MFSTGLSSGAREGRKTRVMFFGTTRRPVVCQPAAPTHAGMIQKPLYHGAISIHGAAPSPDNSLIATTGRGTSNVYLIDTRAKKVLGGRPNPQARADTTPEL